MMRDRFFTVQCCDRCGGTMGGRTQSWFNDEVICTPCSNQESEIKSQLRKTTGSDYEACGLSIKELTNLIKNKG